MTDFPVIIHHNPACGTSRNVVAIVRAAGYAPDIIEYLETGWTRPQLLALFAAAGLTPRNALRETKSPASALGLLEENVTGQILLDAMLEHPVLVNRPIVATPKGIRLCRPSETVLELLENRPTDAVYKEDGEQVWAPPTEGATWQSKQPFQKSCSRFIKILVSPIAIVRPGIPGGENIACIYGDFPDLVSRNFGGILRSNIA